MLVYEKKINGVSKVFGTYGNVPSDDDKELTFKTYSVDNPDTVKVNLVKSLGPYFSHEDVPFDIYLYPVIGSDATICTITDIVEQLDDIVEFFVQSKSSENQCILKILDKKNKIEDDDTVELVSLYGVYELSTNGDDYWWFEYNDGYIDRIVEVIEDEGEPGTYYLLTYVDSIESDYDGQTWTSQFKSDGKNGILTNGAYIRVVTEDSQEFVGSEDEPVVVFIDEDKPPIVNSIAPGSEETKVVYLTTVSAPTKTVYSGLDEFDPTGIVITYYYTDDTSEEIPSEDFTGALDLRIVVGEEEVSMTAGTTMKEYGIDTAGTYKVNTYIDDNFTSAFDITIAVVYAGDTVLVTGSDGDVQEATISALSKPSVSLVDGASTYVTASATKTKVTITQVGGVGTGDLGNIKLTCQGVYDIIPLYGSDPE